MATFSELMQDLCASLGVQAEPDSDLFVLETQGKQAVVTSCKLPSGDDGLYLQLSVGNFPPANDGTTVDALRLLHHLNHQARTTTPWRIVLGDDDMLMMQQTCLLSLGSEGVQAALIDGLERLEPLQALLQEWLPEPDAVELPASGGPNAHIIFA